MRIKEGKNYHFQEANDTRHGDSKENLGSEEVLYLYWFLLQHLNKHNITKQLIWRAI